MAESEPRSVEAEGQPETHGNRLTRALKKIKPGEWILIGVGVIGLIIYFVWYQGQQNSNPNALTPAGGTSNPWSTSNVDPAQLDADLQALTAALQAGLANTPPTASPSGGTPGGTPTPTGGDPDHDKSSSGSDADHDKGSTKVSAKASSGSNMSQASNNQAPVTTTTQEVHKSSHKKQTEKQAQDESVKHPSKAAQATQKKYNSQNPSNADSKGSTGDPTATHRPVRGVNPAA